MIRSFMLAGVFAALAGLSTMVNVRAHEPVDVDLELVLAVDVSDSIDQEEFAFQRGAIAAAFKEPEIIRAMSNGALGRVAVAMVDFSSHHQTRVSVPWHVIRNEESAEGFAAAVLGAERGPSGNTSISSGITMAARLIAASPYHTTRRVIDVSGDGSNNEDDFATEENMSTARDLARSLKIVVNGLPIVSKFEPDLERHYRCNVLTGRGAFLVVAEGVADFARAIRRKLVREIAENGLLWRVGYEPAQPPCSNGH